MTFVLSFPLTGERRNERPALRGLCLHDQGLAPAHPGSSLKSLALLTDEQLVELARDLGTDADDPWAVFASDTPEGELCRERARGLELEEAPSNEPPTVPAEFSRGHDAKESTQQAFGRFFVDLAHEAPDVAARWQPLVLMSPPQPT